MTTRSGFGRWAIVAAALVIGLAAGAAPVGASSARGTGSGTSTTYVGRVTGLDASLGLVIQGDVAFAYLCDGAQLSEWFKGTVKKGTVEARSPSGATLVAEPDKGQLLAALTLADGTLETVTLKKATGTAGLFRAEQIINGDAFAAGWVVLPDGTVTGQVSAINLPGARVIEPPPLVPPPTTAITTAVTVPPVVGVVAPPAIAAAFPPAPPAGSEVEVVPFNAQEVTDEAPGQEANGDTAPSGGPTTTVPEAQLTCDQLREAQARDKKRLNDTTALLESETLSRKERHALKLQIRGIKLRMDANLDLQVLNNC